MPRNTGERQWRMVTTRLGAQEVYYLFRSALKDSLKTEFGQTDINAISDLQPIDRIIVASNNFKPPKASKYIDAATGYEGSFISDSKASSLKADGFNVIRQKHAYPNLSGTARSKLYYTTVNGLKLGYRMNSDNPPSDFTTATGLTLATDGDTDDILLGCTFPKMGIIRHIATKQTFMCDTDKYNNLTTGWARVKPPLYTDIHLARYLGLA